MRSPWITRSSLLAVSFILSQVFLAAANTSDQLSNCSPCQTSLCPQNCLQSCTLECPENYYGSDLVCQTPSTSTTTTTLPTTSTMTTPTNETTQTNQTTPSTPTSETTLPPTTAPVVHLQPQEGNTTEQNSTDTIFNQTDTTVTSTTPTSTTTPQPTKLCRLCSLESCTTCQEGPQKNLICVKCMDGYSVSNVGTSCSKDGLSAGAIIGIVIGIVAFIAIVGVAVFLARRFHGSKEVTNHESYGITSNANDFDSEQYEIGKLGNAPSPPTEDTTKRYDSLKATNQDDPQSYTPIDIQKEARYANFDQSEPKKKHTLYANTPQGNTPGPSASKSPQALKTTVTAPVSSDSMELYEPIDTTRHEKPQEVYVNLAQLLGKQENTTDAKQTQQLYYNDDNVIEEAEYEIT